MALLGWCYKCGKGVEKDDAQAYEWYRKSAEAGNAWGMYLLSECYGNGTGVEMDEKQAQYWKEKAIDAGWEDEI